MNNHCQQDRFQIPFLRVPLLSALPLHSFLPFSLSRSFKASLREISSSQDPTATEKAAWHEIETKIFPFVSYGVLSIQLHCKSSSKQYKSILNLAKRSIYADTFLFSQSSLFFFTLFTFLDSFHSLAIREFRIHEGWCMTFKVPIMCTRARMEWHLVHPPDI